MEKRFWIELSYRYSLPVKFLQEILTSAEFFELLIHEHHYPRDRSDFHAGVVAATVANCNSGRRGKVFKPSDFYPVFKQKVATVAELKAVVFQEFAEHVNKSSTS